MHSDTLKKQVPDFISSTQTFAEIFNTEGAEFDTLYANIDDIEDQFDIDKASWGLDIYEKELGITTNYTKSYADRRSVIKSKWRGSGTLNAALLKSVADSFTNGDVQVTFDGTIHVRFTSFKGIPPNMTDLQNAIEQIKPAYLLLDYLYTFNTNDMLKTKTYNQLHSYAYDQVRTI